MKGYQIVQCIVFAFCVWLACYIPANYLTMPSYVDLRGVQHYRIVVSELVPWVVAVFLFGVVVCVKIDDWFAPHNQKVEKESLGMHRSIEEKKQAEDE